MAKKLLEEYPLVCPFCDELAYIKPRARKKVLPEKIYSLRQCAMGHEFWTVETIPENQSQVVDEIREFGDEIKEWMKDVRKSKHTKDGSDESGEELHT